MVHSHYLSARISPWPAVISHLHSPTGLQMYADDTQIYISICPATEVGVLSAVSKIEACTSEVQDWITHNFLKLNADKTEVLVIGFRAQLLKFNLPSINIARVNVVVRSDPIKNLGVMFDPGMSMNAEVTNIVKAANFHLINISRARRFLTTEATKLAIHALVTSRLDYCNGILIGISNRLLTQLQNIQPTSARLITNRRKFDSITSELI